MIRITTTPTTAILTAAGMLLGSLALVARAQPAKDAPEAPEASATVPVTVESFRRAESDRYFATTVRKGGFGKFNALREPMSVEHQTVVRGNRDTLYSSAVFDLDAGPVAIVLPDAGERFMSMQVIDEDQYTSAVFYGQGKYVLGRQKVGTRYVMVGVRTMVDPSDPKDVEIAHGLQDAIRVEQASPGTFDVPRWDPTTQQKVRDALLVLGATVPDSRRMFGTRDQVDPVRHLIGTAMAWGGNPEREATYLNVTPARNDGRTVHRLVVGHVPVEAFWSISVYDAEGYYQRNPARAYTLNDLTAYEGADGSVTVQFGGCDGKIPNCLPITSGWTYMVRLYRPGPEILSGAWAFPPAQPVL